MIRLRAILARPTIVAPWLSLLVLTAMSTALPNRTSRSVEAAERKVEIAAAMESVPRFIGPWTGVDHDVPREAQELLRPNAILSRRYQQTGGPRVHLLVVHCGDARDMIGHYPPICYPSSGWIQLAPSHDPEQVIDVRGRPFAARVYEFRRAREHGAEEVRRIFNSFVLPDGTVTRDIADINRQSERLDVSIQGVAQLQIMTSTSMTLEEALDAASELLGGMPNLLSALRIGEGGSGES